MSKGRDHMIKVRAFCEECDQEIEIQILSDGKIKPVKCDHKILINCHNCGDPFELKGVNPFKYCDNCKIKRMIPKDDSAVIAKAGIKGVIKLDAQGNKIGLLWGEDLTRGA